MKMKIFKLFLLFCFIKSYLLMNIMGSNGNPSQENNHERNKRQTESENKVNVTDPLFIKGLENLKSLHSEKSQKDEANQQKLINGQDLLREILETLKKRN